MNYYTSDLHFGYDKIISLCNRPFTSLEEMNEILVENMASRITDNDTVYFLGDMAAYGVNAVDYIKQIPGKKILIIGNHDKEPLHHRSFRHCFDDIVSNTIVRDTVNGEPVKIFLSHYPTAEWDGYYKGIWHFYGHVHSANAGGGALIDFLPRAINVGVDLNEFVPKTAEELITERKRTYRKPSVMDFDQVLYPPFRNNGHENVFTYEGFEHL